MNIEHNLSANNEILKTKKEIKFYLKEIIKNIIKLPLVFIKQISLYALSLSNKIIPIVILLSISMSTAWMLITAIFFTIANIIIDIKINNSDIQYTNELTKASDNFCDATYNLIELCEKLRKLKKNNNQKEISNSLVLENDEIKHSQEFQTIFTTDENTNELTDTTGIEEEINKNNNDNLEQKPKKLTLKRNK